MTSEPAPAVLPARIRTADRGRMDEVYPRQLADRERQQVLDRRAAVRADENGHRAETSGNGANGLPADTVGIALSGGGIRSATFCLGVFRTLARLGLVRRLDFVSTVSGGGYFGAFLGGLFTRRHAELAPPSVSYVETVLRELRSEPVQWLRENGRYMSPNGSGDLLQAGAVILRNWVALLVVLSTFVVTIFAGTTLLGTYVPDAARALTDAVPSIPLGTLTKGAFPTIGGVVPSPFFIPVVLLWIAAVIPLGWSFWFTQQGRGGWLPAATALGILALGVAFWTEGPLVRLLVAEATLAVAYCLAARAWAYAKNRDAEVPAGDTGDAAARSAQHRSRIPPVRLARNKLSRLLSITLWASVGLLAFGVVDTVGHELAKARIHERISGTAGLLGTSGALSLLALLQKVAQKVGQSRERRLRLKPQIVASIVAAAIVLTSVVGLAAAVHKLGGEAYQSESDMRAAFASPAGTSEAAASRAPLVDTRQRLGWMAALGLLLTVATAHSPAFLNLSSHQSLYGARLTRAYLGASNPKRYQESTPITDIVPNDEIPLDRYEPHAQGGPLHLINVTLNETVAGRSQLEQKDRKGLGMSIGPSGVSVGTRHHALWSDGSRGQRLEPARAPSAPSRPVPVPAPATAPAPFRIFPDLGDGEHGYDVDPLDLGGWTALSGAAFTTGLGARTSLGTSLLLGLGNIRLGYWWDSGIAPRRRRASARRLAFAGQLERALNVLLPVQTHLLNEVLARFHGPSRRRWYLSDGGHSENTGAYELIRRRVPFIVICDDGRDGTYEFEDLANLVRRVRTDFEAEVAFLTSGQLDKLVDEGIRKQFGTFEELAKDDRGLTQAHALLAYVYYQDPTRAHPPGSLLLVLKPSLTGDEPLDVRNYRTLNPEFPQEPTTDQYFDEAQWESYRRLGEHIASRVFEPAKPGAGKGWRPADLKVPASVQVRT